MSSLRPESHVAQQSRRDKLRVLQHGSTSFHRFQNFPNDLQQISATQEDLNSDLLQVRNVRNDNVLYESGYCPSGMMNFSACSNANTSSVQKETMASHEFLAAKPGRLILSDHFTPFSLSSNPDEGSYESHNFGGWKNIDSGSQHNFDSLVNYVSEVAGNINDSDRDGIFVGQGINLSPSYQNYSKTIDNRLQDAHASLSNSSGGFSSPPGHKQLGERNHIPYATPLYQSTLQDIVKSASASSERGKEIHSLVPRTTREADSSTCIDSGNELLLLPPYGNQSNMSSCDGAEIWMDRSLENCPRWEGSQALGILAQMNEQRSPYPASDFNPQGLSLSLSSNPQANKHSAIRHREESGSVDLPPGIDNSKDTQHRKSSPSRKGCSVVGTSANIGFRSMGPLGPFTGYSTILKNSRFLKFAQQLLDEFCILNGLKLEKTCDVIENNSAKRSASTSADTSNGIDNGASLRENTLGTSSSKAYHSCDTRDEVGVASSSHGSFQPEFQQKMEKLLYMQEEVNRRYKQYHQQMQIVFSSFQSVAGLSSATPYIQVALKTVSKHFKCLKNAISEQLKHVRQIMEEGLTASMTGVESNKGDSDIPRMKHMEQSFHMQKPGSFNAGFLEPQQSVWKPQRGLPERSVTILRAWLFEHFLHPYPTDTDKHMLATQTGLSRNQVSNWFINARVRVWKPMVEEIHMLETRKNIGTSYNNAICETRAYPGSKRFDANFISEKQLQCSGTVSPSLGGVGSMDGPNAEVWNLEKGSKLNSHIASDTEDSSIIGFVPYQGSELEIGGLGSVSLTLGLRHGVETVQQYSQQQIQEDQLRRQFGGHMIHDLRVREFRPERNPLRQRGKLRTEMNKFHHLNAGESGMP